MRINEGIFKSYDIRGVYSDDFDNEFAYNLGRAYVVFLKEKNPKIAVGRDNRLSSPSLFKSLVKGIVDQGGSVIDIGLSTTPMLYFAVAHFKLDGGIQVTASHNPANNNGFKIVRKGAVPVSGKTGLMEIKRILLEGTFRRAKKGKIIKKKVLDQYVAFNFKKTRIKKNNLKVVVDTANSVSGILIPKLSKKFGCKIIHIFSKQDGRFPNHEPDPLKKKNLKALCAAVKKEKADFGLAFDGDGDRMFFVDEKAGIVTGDIATALAAQILLRDNPGQKILLDVRASRAAEEAVREAGGKPVLWKVGHSFIKLKMRKENILFGGEVSGHYYSRDHYFCEAPIFVAILVMKEILEKKTSLSMLVAPLRKYSNSGEINFKVKDKKKIIARLEKEFKSGKISKIDGLRIDFEDWWFCVRASNTEPLLRLIAEAKNKKLLQKKTAFISKLIGC